jgi:hypothetical protein
VSTYGHLSFGLTTFGASVLALQKYKMPHLNSPFMLFGGTFAALIATQWIDWYPLKFAVFSSFIGLASLTTFHFMTASTLLADIALVSGCSMAGLTSVLNMQVADKRNGGVAMLTCGGMSISLLALAYP